MRKSCKLKLHGSKRFIPLKEISLSMPGRKKSCFCARVVRICPQEVWGPVHGRTYEPYSKLLKGGSIGANIGEYYRGGY